MSVYTLYVHGRMWCRSNFAATHGSLFASTESTGRGSDHDRHSYRWLRYFRWRSWSVFCPGAVPDDLVDTVDDAGAAIAAKEERQHNEQCKSLALLADRFRRIRRSLLWFLLTYNNNNNNNNKKAELSQR